LDAEANLEKAAAMLEQSQSEYDRNLKLYEKDFISESEFLTYKIGLKNQKANVKSAEASLQRAERNLKYAVIRSPISGTVISRNVEEGQTVAASFSTPTLFQIAEDLSNMEILVDVDESDIGLIEEGQKVTFEVQAYTDRFFDGIVEQVRLQPNVVSNVVNYTVVVGAANKDNLLLPGMTATVDFIVEERKDILLVPRSAVRFRPPEEMLAEFRERRRREFEAIPDSLRERGAGRGLGFQRSTEGNFADRFRKLRESTAQLWYIDSSGTLQMERILTGISDGKNTEIVRLRKLSEGSSVISGTLSGEEPGASANSRQPFGTPPPPGGRRGF
jgi:HlyD family secretion protein